jgi:hypothetical protein
MATPTVRTLQESTTPFDFTNLCLGNGFDGSKRNMPAVHVLNVIRFA